MGPDGELPEAAIEIETLLEAMLEAMSASPERCLIFCRLRILRESEGDGERFAPPPASPHHLRGLRLHAQEISGIFAN